MLSPQDEMEQSELLSCWAGSMSRFNPATGLEGGIRLTRLKLQLQAIRGRMSRQIPIHRFLRRIVAMPLGGSVGRDPHIEHRTVI